MFWAREGLDQGQNDRSLAARARHTERTYFHPTVEPESPLRLSITRYIEGDFYYARFQGVLLGRARWRRCSASKPNPISSCPSSAKAIVRSLKPKNQSASASVPIPTPGSPRSRRNIVPTDTPARSAILATVTLRRDYLSCVAGSNRIPGGILSA